MIRINVHEAKAHLSRYLDRLARGETIVICRRNVPIAELRPVAGMATSERPFGDHRGEFSVPEDFNAPLSEEELELWEGK